MTATDHQRPDRNATTMRILRMPPGSRLEIDSIPQLNDHIEANRVKPDEGERDDIAALVQGGFRVALVPYDPDDVKAIRALRMVIEAAERAVDDIRSGMGIDHSVNALGTNAGVALRECGAYSRRQEEAAIVGSSCVDCKTQIGISFKPCPYAQDAKGDETPVWLCAPCASTRASDL